MKQPTSGRGFSAPFPHTIIDNFLTPEEVCQVNREWPGHTAFDKEDGKGQRKWATSNLTPTAQRIAESVTSLLVESTTGIAGTFPDPDLYGAGLHEIPRGGFLKMHCDFNRHPKGWRRAVNVLVYLNEEWQAAWCGDLVLSSDGRTPDVLIPPVGGRAVIFETNDRTWHGHPAPLRTPEGITRRSMALYF